MKTSVTFFLYKGKFIVGQTELAKELAQEEYTRQIKLRTGGVLPPHHDMVVKSLMITLPVREDGSIGITLCWEDEKVVEMYHKGPVTFIVGFYPKASK